MSLSQQLSPVHDISDLTAAESWMLLKPTWSLREDLLKYTVMDLLVRKVLEIHKKPFSRENDRREPKVYRFVVCGENFEYHQPALFERPIMELFPTKTTGYFVRNFAKAAYKKTKDLDTVKATVAKTLIGKGFIPKISIGGCWGMYQLTAAGRKRRNQINSALDYVDSRLATIAGNPDELQLVLTRLGTNFVLLKNLDLPMIRAIGSTIKGFDIQAAGTNTGWDSVLAFDAFSTVDFGFSDFDFGGMDFGGGDFSSMDFGGGDFGGFDF